MSSPGIPESPQPPPFVAPVIGPQPLPPQPARGKSTWVRVVLVFAALALFGSVLLNLLLLALLAVSAGREPRIQEKFISGDRHAKKKVAVFSVEGVILDGEGFYKDQIDHARRDAEEGNLRAMVVRIDSPGGTVSGSDFIYHHLRELRQKHDIPLVVSMGSIAASGGYYVAMCVGDAPRVIFAEPTTWTGSIGVMIPHYDLSVMLEKLGIRENAITSHPLKGMGSITRPMTEKERQIFQSLVDESFEQFKEIVRSGRPKFRETPAALDELATGEVFTAQRAKQAGLIDEIGFLEEAIERAIELTGLGKDRVCVVKYKPEPTLFHVLFGTTSRARYSLDVAGLLELSSPRAYYLYSWLPPLVRNGS